MDITQLSLFVEATARSSSVNFALDGEQITPKDLGDPHGLLPLVMVAVNHIHEQISGLRPSHLNLVEPADPSTHLLGWRVTSLPAVPEGVCRLMVNHAVRTLLANPPNLGLYNPCLRETDIKGKESDLRQHLDAFHMSSQKILDKSHPESQNFTY